MIEQTVLDIKLRDINETIKKYVFTGTSATVEVNIGKDNIKIAETNYR